LVPVVTAKLIEKYQLDGFGLAVSGLLAVVSLGDLNYTGGSPEIF